MKHIKKFGKFMNESESDINDIYYRSDFPEGSVSNCCGAVFNSEDICSDCGEHAIPKDDDMGENKIDED